MHLIFATKLCICIYPVFMTPAVLSPEPTPGDRTRWLELINRLSVDTLTQSFLTLVGDVPGYNPSPVPLAELERTAALSFEALIDGIRHDDLPEEHTIATELGVSRARSGVPLASLMSAIRHDFTALWSALIDVAEPSDAELIVRHTGIVMRTVELFASQTQQAYSDERHRMDDEASSVRQGIIATLFQTPQPSRDRLEAISANLGIAPNAELLVAVAVGNDIDTLRAHAAECERSGAHIETHHLGDALCVFAHSYQLPGSRIMQLVNELHTLRVGITYATGIEHLAPSAHTARLLAQNLTASDVEALLWESGWARVARRLLSEASTDPATEVNAALSTCNDSERARLEEAVRAYLATGSISTSAAALFCHRNTLTNRLQRFTDLTGINPLVPESAARLVVAWA